MFQLSGFYCKSKGIRLGAQELLSQKGTLDLAWNPPGNFLPKESGVLPGISPGFRQSKGLA